ncbi:CRISPR-associated helicase/endonuclease Cas3 [Lamprobacter modestohalophilus]|uniref:CRISPR-associated helicase/endonuclease Cas3 n=1 Tax=Lamprobacter modestohalophilus TaxID=1064514 RepID=UPI002ADEF2E6|nr:CRISPR-associated helicase/endonuclease Cas3 [Lamprobacter modestohalophilus]MEA1050879.1 CRISPR-associated helicase/endonuclease Cas3 [Lamprobacter modestohalophilus]
MTLTIEFRSYWAKAKPNDEGEAGWHPFAYHSLDVAAVAAALWDQSPAIRHSFRVAFGAAGLDSEATLRAWVLFFVALHDIGKLHALFQILAPNAVAECWPELTAETVFKQTDRYDHGLDGLVSVQSEIADWTGAGDRQIRKGFKPWLGAVMGHHGDLPVSADAWPTSVRTPKHRYAQPAVLQRDRQARHDWVRVAGELFLQPVGLSLADQPPTPDVAAHRLLAGFCSLCDWIGSNTDYFPYARWRLTPEAYFQAQLERIRQQDILRQVGLIANLESCNGLQSLLRPDEQPRGVQALVDRLDPAPTLTIVEAPTGSGKTEAALAHAWRLLESECADAIIFALPTQATANAMLARAMRFAEQAFGGANVVLAHGHRAFNPAFQQLVDAGRRRTAQGGVEASLQCASWLASSRKRVFLGQVGVCTVDQVLLSVLPVRHSFVRSFGVARAVLIIDEVHAYDAYMNGLLTEVLKRHRAVGGSAILLSATLPASIRNTLLNAWGGDGPEDAPYPVVWQASSAATTANTLPDDQQPAERTVDVELMKLADAFPDTGLIDRIIAAAKANALVGIVMNTVQDAQRLASLLRERSDCLVDLFHARFRLCDRQRIEEQVIGDYGRDADRARGRILVATQVIEQSLDLDFDWLITQICPVDLLFQRIGRLHRHLRHGRPAGFVQPLCSVISVADDDYALHELIYGDPRLLWRTEQLLAEAEQMHFPAAYRSWIEQVYSETAWDDEPEEIYGKHLGWRDCQRAAMDTARQRASMTISQFRDEDHQATALTRDGEMGLTVLPLLDDSRFLDGTRLEDLDEFQRLERLALNAVPVPRSWEKWLIGCDYDDEGRLRLLMQAEGEGVWAASLEQAFRYSIARGLEKASREETPAGAEAP